MITNDKIQNSFKRIILFSSLNGGTGKSFIAKHFAITYAKTHKVGLIDSDINSLGLTFQLPISLPKIKNIVDKTEKTIPHQIKSKTDSHGNTMVYPLDFSITKKFKYKFMSVGPLDIGSDLLGVRGGMLSSISRLLINEVNWGDIDYLLIDTPSGLSDIELTLLDDFPNSEILLVSNGHISADKRKIEYYLNRGVNIVGLLYNNHNLIIDLEQEYITFCKDLNIDFLGKFKEEEIKNYIFSKK